MQNMQDMKNVKDFDTETIDLGSLQIPSNNNGKKTKNGGLSKQLKKKSSNEEISTIFDQEDDNPPIMNFNNKNRKTKDIVYIPLSVNGKQHHKSSDKSEAKYPNAPQLVELEKLHLPESNKLVFPNEVLEGYQKKQDVQSAHENVREAFETELHRLIYEHTMGCVLKLGANKKTVKRALTYNYDQTIKDILESGKKETIKIALKHKKLKEEHKNELEKKLNPDMQNIQDFSDDDDENNLQSNKKSLDFKYENIELLGITSKQTIEDVVTLGKDITGGDFLIKGVNEEAEKLRNAYNAHLHLVKHIRNLDKEIEKIKNIKKCDDENSASLTKEQLKNLKKLFFGDNGIYNAIKKLEEHAYTLPQRIASRIFTFTGAAAGFILGFVLGFFSTAGNVFIGGVAGKVGATIGGAIGYKIGTFFGRFGITEIQKQTREFITAVKQETDRIYSRQMPGGCESFAINYLSCCRPKK